MASVTLRNVGKSYAAGRPTLVDVNVTIADGEFAIIVGPSGCGKSTLLRMLAGLEDISEGEIAIDGRVVNKVPAKDRDIAMVFQNYALYPHMSVAENMAFGLRMRGYPRAEIDKRVADAADVLGLTPLLERRPEALSGGQRQRVAVGRAIVRQPRLFLFDEPLSNLDAKLRVAMRAELIKLHKRLAATMVYVTHDQVEAMSMGDRLIVMKDGRVQQVGTPLEIYDRPANQFVAGFLGSPPMNFLECDLVPDSDGASLTGAGWRLPLRGSARFAAEAASGPRPVVAGLRPESLYERPGEEAAGQGLPARIEFLEPLGSEVLATCRLGGQEIVVRLAARTTVRAGQDIELRVDLERLCLFDPGSGVALP
jgi:multiple sugar transport system ATP-binding protein